MSRLIKAIAVTAALGIPFLLPTVLIAGAWTAAPLALLESFTVWIPILIFIVGSFAYRKETLSEMKLTQKKERMATSVFEHITEGIMVADSLQTIQYVNPAFSSITGYTEEDIVGASPKILSSGKHNREFYDNMWSSIRLRGSWQGEIWNRRKNGDIFLESITITAVKESVDSVAYYIAVFKDITVQKQLEARLRHQAYHDTVTGLPNRLLLNERIAEAIQHADHNRRIFAVLFLDLDRFKRINDTLGHSVGDQLLKTIAERLVSCLRGSDTIARIGGDEFVVLLCGMAHAEDGVAIAQNMIQSLTSPIFSAGMSCM
jgi:diguanylate cyclase (GGDEF)-like protein/PAS domain S-box-containing protein